MKLHALIALGSLTTGAASAAQTRLLVVDAAGGPGVDHRSVQAAVLAAAEADIVLVRPGIYDEDVVIEGKALTLLGTAGPSRPVIGGLQVRGTAAGSDVSVRGLSVLLDSFSALRVEGCAGKVWLEELHVDTDPSANFSSGMGIEDSAAVVLTRCALAAPHATFATGLSVTRSTVQLFHTSLTGADSDDQLFEHGFEGGAALLVEDGRVFGAGGTLAGGAGGSILSPICALRAGNGGTALRVRGTSRVELQGCTLVGGAGGTSCGQDGLPGEPMVVEGGEVVVTPTLARGCQLEALGRMGRSSSAVLDGRPGELALLLCSPATAPASTAALFRGRLLLDDPLSIPYAAFVPASGELVLPLAIPRFLGADALRLHAQGLFLDPAVGLVLSNPSSLVILGAHQLPAGPP